MVTDPIGDFIARMVNAGAVHKSTVEVSYSKIKHAIADTLVTAGFLKSAEKQGKKAKKTLRVELSYDQVGTPRIEKAVRVSKPGRRMYLGASHIKPVKGGKGAIILSTPEGILTGSDARKKNIGGEALFTVW